MYKGKNVSESEMVPGVEYYAQQGSALVGRFRLGDVLPVGAVFYEIVNNWEKGDPIPARALDTLLHDDDLVLVKSARGSEVNSVGIFRALGYDFADGETTVYRLHINNGVLHQNFAKPKMGDAVVDDEVRGFKI